MILMFHNNVFSVGNAGRVNEFFCTSSHRCLRDCFDYPSETDAVVNCAEYSFINCSKFVKLVYCPFASTSE